MSEKTLLKEIEKDQEKELEKKLQTLKEEGEKLREEQPKARETRKEIFSASAFPAEEVEKLKQKYAQTEVEQPEPTEEEEINKIESKVSSVIEKPNYDYMQTLSEKQRKKVFVFKKEKSSAQAKPRASKFKMIMISILFAIFGTWGIVNIATIDNVASQITEVSSQYHLNLFNYIKNLYMLDATNSENMKNLFETIPEEGKAPTKIEVESNWFDRICNFLEGLIGG